MPKIPEKFMGLLGKFADSLDYNDLPQDWANNKQIVAAAEELYRDMGTESPFFKAWFGNSKVVDEAGRPAHVYHGTNAYELKKFKPGKTGYLGGGIYTTPSREMAERYTDYGTVHDLYEKMERPFIIDTVDATERVLDELYGTKAGRELAKREAKSGGGSFLLTKNDAKKLQGMGYDGIFWDAPSGREYATLDPTAVKATSNRGTFNPADPNIYRSAGPLAVGAGAGAAVLGAGDAQAFAPYSVPSDIQAQWNSFRQSGKLPEKPLEAPVWSPADLAVAPIGAATTAGKAAAMAADPLMSYGADKLGGLLGYFWGS
ncbi:hypothetical protein [Desulfovibrio piger]|jgi:hypothetical protein|uniref:ADP-ribosyltransferase-containing protein n=1 Tax=Desulfovibrio piger TaxID=901 RepID=UPI0039F4E6A3